MPLLLTAPAAAAASVRLLVSHLLAPHDVQGRVGLALQQPQKQYMMTTGHTGDGVRGGRSVESRWQRDVCSRESRTNAERRPAVSRAPPAEQWCGTSCTPASDGWTSWSPSITTGAAIIGTVMVIDEKLVRRGLAGWRVRTPPSTATASCCWFEKRPCCCWLKCCSQ